MQVTPGELLDAAQFLGELPDRLFVVGLEPQEIRTGWGLTARMPFPTAHQVRGLLTQLC